MHPAFHRHRSRPRGSLHGTYVHAQHDLQVCTVRTVAEWWNGVPNTEDLALIDESWSSHLPLISLDCTVLCVLNACMYEKQDNMNIRLRLLSLSSHTHHIYSFHSFYSLQRTWAVESRSETNQWESGRSPSWPCEIPQPLPRSRMGPTGAICVECLIMHMLDGCRYLSLMCYCWCRLVSR